MNRTTPQPTFDRNAGQCPGVKSIVAGARKAYHQQVRDPSRSLRFNAQFEFLFFK
jgi:hypothetical protein